MFKEPVFNTKIEPLKKGGFTVDFQIMEGDFYRGKIKYEDVLEFLKESLLKHPEENEIIEGKIALFQAMFDHEEANEKYYLFNADLVRPEMEGQPPRPIDGVKRDEVMNEFIKSKDANELVKLENRIIDGYMKALDKWQDSPYLDRSKVEAMILDLKFRQAERIENGDERDRVIGLLDSEQQVVISRTEIGGMRAETQAIFLLNRWARKEGKSHIYHAEHALPLRHHAAKADIIISYGDQIAEVSLKTLSSDSNVKEFNEAIVKEEEKKLQGTRVVQVVIDSADLRDAYAGQSRETGSQKSNTRKLNKFAGQLNENIITFAPKPAKEKKQNVKSEFFDGHSNVPWLLRFGYLNAENRNDPRSILDGKEKLEKDLHDQKIFSELLAIAEIEKEQVA